PWLSRFNYKIFGNDALDPGSMDKAQVVGSERGGGGRPEMPSFRNPTYGQFELSGNYAGAQARGYEAIRQQRLFETFGDNGLTQAAETSVAGGIGTHQGMGGARGVMETSAGTAERKKADWEAFKKESQDRGYSSPGEMTKVFSQMDYGQKAQAIDDIAQ
ncbi:MAG: hypothetical protein HY730_00245, partial [Candidatus Tectomicrobia bacterium]|nr:hypothetical protein [Candidatus Tectomicrobia bacterium]